MYWIFNVTYGKHSSWWAFLGPCGTFGNECQCPQLRPLKLDSTEVTWDTLVRCQLPPGRRDYPNVGIYGGLLARILISFQTLFVHVAHVMGGRQLSKVVLWVFFGHCSPPPLLSPRRLKVFLLPASGDDTHTLSRATPCTITVYVCCSECLAALSDRLRTTGSTSETCSFPFSLLY